MQLSRPWKVAELEHVILRHTVYNCLTPDILYRGPNLQVEIKVEGNITNKHIF